MKRIRGGMSLGLGLIVLLLAGCGGGGGSTANVTTPGKNSVAASISTSVPAAICPTGGIAINTGIDTNGNGVLDASEITNTQYVCNGTAAANALMSVTDEPAGANCTAGGKKISVGLDTDNNGTLDAAEVTSSSYICNGANGSNGLNTLVSTSGEAPGANCVYGGIKVNSGLDTNSNGTLDAAEITSTGYACNVSAGSGGFAWVDVTASSVQAASNMGYMANSASAVAVTLPVAPAVGDVVKVSGVGAGGWLILPNAGQKIIRSNLSSNPNATVRRNQVFGSIASSSDGSKFVAANSYGHIYTSSDSGVTWALQASPEGNWSSVASSADGYKLVAAVSYGQIYTSTDSGMTWTLQASSPVAPWQSVATSSDGSKLVAVAGNSVVSSQIYTSTDSGVTWTLQANSPVASWYSVASSNDGSKLAAVVSGGQIYTSTDSGVSWTLQANSPVANWDSVVSSSDGSKLVAVAWGGQKIYTSADSGVTWTLQANSPMAYMQSVASSSDGSKLVVVVGYSDKNYTFGGQIYTSTDSGVTWTLQASPVAYWRSVASSSDGSKLVAASTEGQIFTSVDSGVTWVRSAPLLGGSQYSAIELQYIGNNTFMVLSSTGAIAY